MQLTVLGNNGPFPGVGAACSGYLLEDGETRVLVDCGNGVLSRLQRYTSIDKLNGIIISHLHSDHMSDLLVLRYAIDIMQSRGIIEKPIDLYIPFQPEEEAARLSYKGAFNINQISEDWQVKIGTLNFSFRQVKHPVPTYAVKVQGRDKTFVYSADTSWTEELISFAEGCDLLLCEAAVLERDKGENAVHLTPGECGEIARRAGVKRLLLTHFWPGYELEEILKEAKDTYPHVEATQELKTYPI